MTSIHRHLSLARLGVFAALIAFVILAPSSAVRSQDAQNQPAATVVAAAPSESTPKQAEESRAVVQQLTADDFSVRLAARGRLEDVPAADLRQAVLAPGLNPEAAVALLAELERRYQSMDLSDAGAAVQDRLLLSELLEKLKTDRRLVLADGASRILNEHWRVRVALARRELEKVGAYVRSGSFTSRDELRWLPGRGLPSIQILLGEDFTGGMEGIDLIERMSRLTDPGLGVAGISVWLLEGHKLTDPEYARLSQLVGQNRIQERSRIALGIRSRPGVASGVIIESVTKGSSAADAGLNSMDLLVSIVEPIPEDASPAEREEAEKKAELRDFDDLVERLKKYRDGDIIQLKVVRGAGHLTRNNFFGPAPDLPQQIPLKEEIVSVTLKGWEKLPVETD